MYTILILTVIALSISTSYSHETNDGNVLDNWNKASRSKDLDDRFKIVVKGLERIFKIAEHQENENIKKQTETDKNASDDLDIPHPEIVKGEEKRFQIPHPEAQKKSLHKESRINGQDLLKRLLNLLQKS